MDQDDPGQGQEAQAVDGRERVVLLHVDVEDLGAVGQRREGHDDLHHEPCERFQNAVLIPFCVRDGPHAVHLQSLPGRPQGLGAAGALGWLDAVVLSVIVQRPKGPPSRAAQPRPPSRAAAPP